MGAAARLESTAPGKLLAGRADAAERASPACHRSQHRPPRPSPAEHPGRRRRRNSGSPRRPGRRPPHPHPTLPPLTLGSEAGEEPLTGEPGAGTGGRDSAEPQHGRGQHEVALGRGQAALAEGVQARQQLGRPALDVLVAHGASVQQVDPGRLASALESGPWRLSASFSPLGAAEAPAAAAAEAAAAAVAAFSTATSIVLPPPPPPPPPGKGSVLCPPPPATDLPSPPPPRPLR